MFCITKDEENKEKAELTSLKNQLQTLKKEQ